ncbi:MAG: glycosyltransferase family 4 protein [Candidatus Omnitrophica bacterium]|nr:glycosyltransferase family 4 protein [Candidatus Omnitrophota bacterium]
MKIGIISPLWKRVPPKKYGGTEYIVSLIASELVKKKYEVYLFASGDSETSGNLIPIVEKNLHELLGEYQWNNLNYDLYQMKIISKYANEIEIFHNHNGFVPLYFKEALKKPILTTLHSSLPFSKDLAFYVKDEPYVSISNAQRNLAPYLNFVATIYHGIPVELFPFQREKKDYVVFLGTISPYKGTDRAIKIAMKSGIKLIIAGELRKEFKTFFDTKIKPYIDGKNVEFIGELTFSEKVDILKEAKALLLPVRWEEAFGLVMIESMACGTPVIAYNKGAVPEVIKDKETGFIVNNIKDAVKALKRVETIDPLVCRSWVEKKFSAKRMVDEYEKLYQDILVQHRTKEI